MTAEPGPEISVAIPCLNEAENVGAIAAAVAEALAKAGVAAWDLTFIDNGSTDGTVALIRALCAGDARIRLIVNTRDFGQIRSPTHAIYQTTGRAVIGLCADFQDPPALIGELIARWRAGALIVMGVRKSETQSFARRVTRALGYGLLERFGDYRVIPGATGFGLYDRKVVEALKAWRDPEPFFRGMLVESGYRLETIAYDRPPRRAGIAKNDFAALVAFGLSGVANSSKKLMRAPIYFALWTAPLAGLATVAAILAALLRADVWPWVFLAVGGAGFSIIFVFLGLMGEQVRLIAEMARGVPLVIEAERVNFPPEDPGSNHGTA